MSKNFDYIVIGSGLPGLILATRLSQETEKVALIETKDIMGGHQRSALFKNIPYNNGLRFLPATHSANQGLHFLENILGLKLSQSVHEVSPVTYEEGEVKTFLGFGDQSPAFYDEINYFLNPAFHQLHLQPYEWATLLFKNFKGTFIGRSQVTQMKVENEQVVGLTINGSTQYKAENYVYCGSVHDLVKILPEEALASRTRQKMMKLRGWSAVGLDLIHSAPVTDSLATHLLNGTTQDDIGPCVGRFQNLFGAHAMEGSAPTEDLSISQWLTFVENKDLEDPEIVAAALKKIKKQIKRAYPTALDSLIQERIVVTPNYSLFSHQDIKLQANQTWPEVHNLWIGSPSVHPQKNLVGGLLQSELVLSSMGFAETPVLAPEETSIEAQI